MIRRRNLVGENERRTTRRASQSPLFSRRPSSLLNLNLPYSVDAGVRTCLLDTSPIVSAQSQHGRYVLSASKLPMKTPFIPAASSVYSTVNILRGEQEALTTHSQYTAMIISKDPESAATTSTSCFGSSAKHYNSTVSAIKEHTVGKYRLHNDQGVGSKMEGRTSTFAETARRR